jgi:hypothetical protein
LLGQLESIKKKAPVRKKELTEQERKQKLRTSMMKEMDSQEIVNSVKLTDDVVDGKSLIMKHWKKKI